MWFSIFCRERPVDEIAACTRKKVLHRWRNGFLSTFNPSISAIWCPSSCLFRAHSFRLHYLERLKDYKIHVFRAVACVRPPVPCVLPHRRPPQSQIILPNQIRKYYCPIKMYIHKYDGRLEMQASKRTRMPHTRRLSVLFCYAAYGDDNDDREEWRMNDVRFIYYWKYNAWTGLAR